MKKLFFLVNLKVEHETHYKLTICCWIIPVFLSALAAIIDLFTSHSGGGSDA